MSIEFGDSEPDDSYTTEAEPDPEQVARRLHELRKERERETIDWDELSASERLILVAIIAKLFDWLRREGTLR